jgi:hypothetical protein
VVINPVFHLLTSVWKVDMRKVIVNAAGRRWRAKNRDYCNQLAKSYREIPEKRQQRAEYLRKWRAENRERHRATRRARYAQMKGQQSSESTTPTSISS